jgi:head-tail adaptor
MRSLYPDAVEVLRAPVVTGYGGQQVRDWTTATATSAKASVQPVSSLEDTTDRDTTVSRWRLRTPLTTDLTETDRVQWGDLVLEVDGDVETWSPDRPRVGHRAAYLRRAIDR